MGNVGIAFNLLSPIISIFLKSITYQSNIIKMSKLKFLTKFLVPFLIGYIGGGY